MPCELGGQCGWSMRREGKSIGRESGGCWGEGSPSRRPFEAMVRMMAGTVREKEATRGMT